MRVRLQTGRLVESLLFFSPHLCTGQILLTHLKIISYLTTFHHLHHNQPRSSQHHLSPGSIFFLSSHFLLHQSRFCPHLTIGLFQVTSHMTEFSVHSWLSAVCDSIDLIFLSSLKHSFIIIIIFFGFQNTALFPFSFCLTGSSPFSASFAGSPSYQQHLRIKMFPTSVIKHLSAPIPWLI